MQQLKLYSFFVCLIVYVLFIIVFSALLSSIYKMNIKLIRHGVEDKRLIIEYQKKNRKKSICDIITNVFSCVVSICFIFVFMFSFYVQVLKPEPTGNFSIPLVVKSGSMSKKYEDNKYLFENNLNDQINTFDLIFISELPKEEDLKLYDIVVYEVEGELIVHRIVGIDEPNSNHPNNRYFLLQGDAVKNPDYFPVLYDQMVGIYNGKRIPMVGTFIAFLQSPAGYLCLILVVFYVIIAPILSKKIVIEEEKRVKQIASSSPEKKEDVPDSTTKTIKKGLMPSEKKINRKIKRAILIFLSIFLAYSISQASASWKFASDRLNDISDDYRVNLDWPILSSTAKTLAENIVNHPTNGMNNSKSYLNDQISSRWSKLTIGGRRNTLGSMAATQGDDLDEDFNLTAGGVDFLLHFIDDDNDGDIDYYYLYICEVYLGKKGEINFWGTSNKTPGEPTTPIGEYIYPIHRFKVTKVNGKWTIGVEEIGSCKSVWYEESRSSSNATQIPSFDPNTWVDGNETN